MNVGHLWISVGPSVGSGSKPVNNHWNHDMEADLFPFSTSFGKTLSHF